MHDTKNRVIDLKTNEQIFGHHDKKEEGAVVEICVQEKLES